ncbi:uncharacterized protein LOC114541435 isoform X2 [Dendronephthya gigantea]|uniref:uncharacterized protein LOC114524907 isoform X2 n=1 Tax=Dendronephthya gigantea TaxID=151771 RepID=UPI00106B4C5E|nr:uncharacterized protein LOC114524907 isoform X2 [Dendronephthya gigantea]XP_028417155.1 uncharacterized protein LOC114541435 isoform X2 [Dendronephthya gigantea]
MSRKGRCLWSLIVLAILCFLAVLTNAQRKERGTKCTIDILVLLDTSFSIGPDNFRKKVKPFLKKFGSIPELNVSPDGTHIAIYAFSSKKMTKLLLPFEKGYGPQYNKTVDRINWERVRGPHTRTDYGFQQVGRKIFSQRSPLNYRPQYDDVILLLTDGEPHGITDVRRKAIEQARIIKDRGIIVVGLGVGNVNMDTLEKLSTPGDAVMASFESIHTEIERLVASSCQVFQPAENCKCPARDLGDLRVNPDRLTRDVFWEIPEPECPEGLKTELKNTLYKPDVSSGNEFSIGRQEIVYLYSVKSVTDGRSFSDVQCDIVFEVKACKCPEVNIGTKYIKQGDRNTNVVWAMPRPTCGGRLKTSPNERSGQSFAPGVYRITYVYSTPSRIDVTCTIRFEVKECGCPLPVPKTFNVVPGETTTTVSWNVPKPTCSEAIRDTIAPEVIRSGQPFSIGQHALIYTYNMNNQFDLTCAVMFEVRGPLCRERGYNPANQICCCGTVHNIIPRYECCDQDYYSLNTQQCCANSIVRDKTVSCPRQ